MSMNCQQTTQRMQSWLDGELDAETLSAFRAHLDRCPRCRAKADDWRALQAALRDLPAPVPPPGLTERMWAARAKRNRRAVALAAAASVVLALAAAYWMPPTSVPPAPRGLLSPMQGAEVRLPLHRSETIQLALSSASDLDHVRLTLILPRNLELDGFRQQRVISWTTDLRAGDNRLSLPVNARAPGDGELIARIEHAGQRKELRVHVTTASASSAPDQSRRKARHAFALALVPTTTAKRSHHHA